MEGVNVDDGMDGKVNTESPQKVFKSLIIGSFLGEEGFFGISLDNKRVIEKLSKNF